jgi:hypothetical protein
MSGPLQTAVSRAIVGAAAGAVLGSIGGPASAAFGAAIGALSFLLPPLPGLTPKEPGKAFLPPDSAKYMSLPKRPCFTSDVAYRAMLESSGPGAEPLIDLFDAHVKRELKR